MSTSAKYVWKFFRAGGLDQVNLQSGADLLALDQLDQKLWVALSCPTRGLEFDSKTLDLIDTDKDGRIRVPEILEAVRWITRQLKNPDDLFSGSENFPLSLINDKEESGARLLAAARQILTDLGKPEATSISIADTADTTRVFAQTQFNGDGVIPPDSIADPVIKQVALDIIATVGGIPERVGAAGVVGIVGVNQAKLDQFSLELQNYSDWWQKAQTPPQGEPPILILGDATPAAWESLKAVRSKMGDYFVRSRLAAFDSRAVTALNRAEADFIAMAPKNLAGYGDDVAGLPLARIEPDQPLPLAKGLNPAWAQAIDQFRSNVVDPLLGPDKSSLTEAEWKTILERFVPFERWLALKQGAIVEKLGLARVREILAGPGRDVLSKLIAQDLALAPVLAEIATVEKLIRYYRDLPVLLNNFISFSDFYAKDRLAIFQAGTLFMDGRSCRLCLKVSDAATHAPMAHLGGIYLAYCECKRAGSADKLIIAAAFTGGDADQLRVGRNGIFYDRKGQDWDATIIRTVEHPISIRQAFWYPYKRIGRMISEQIEKLASAREKAIMDQAAASLDAAAKAAESGKVEKPKFDTGTLAAIGIIMSSLVSAFGALVASLLLWIGNKETELWWRAPLVFLGLMLTISGPSMLIAWLKLRTRDLAPVLDACGWAINSRIKLNLPLARTLTDLAVVPTNAIHVLEDLYPDDPPKVPKWARGLLLFAILAALLEFTGVLRFIGLDDCLIRFFLHK